MIWPERGRDIARELFPVLEKCENAGCNADAVDRHHIDGNTYHNERENLMFLCRKCHMEIDGRLAVLASYSTNRKPKPSKPCSICGRLFKPLRKGRCQTCAKYWENKGVERPYKIDGHQEKYEAKQKLPCKRCGKPAGWNGVVIIGHCRLCYDAIRLERRRARRAAHRNNL